MISQLLQTMDFSVAQRKAHAIAYANASVEELGPLYHQLDKPVRERQYELLIREAETMEIGCDVHFERSLLRVRKTAAIVNPELGPRFENLIRILRGRHTTLAEFEEAKAALLKAFPRLKPWISWWMDQPSIASMIFPVKSVVDPSLRDQVPSTSNPVEHQHSLLNHSVGSHHDLVPGATLLPKHDLELEAQYKAVKGEPLLLHSTTPHPDFDPHPLDGLYDPVPPRHPLRPRQQKPFDNDGRAPDTVEALRQPLDLSPIALMAYPWLAPNSCFIDASLELWYHAQLELPLN